MIVKTQDAWMGLRVINPGIAVQWYVRDHAPLLEEAVGRVIVHCTIRKEMLEGDAPYFRKVKEIVDSGDLGRIVQISIAFNGFARRWDWQCIQDYNGGNLLNTGPHPLDQALRFLNYDGMTNVMCRMDKANTYGDAEDYVKLILTAPDRPLIDIEISSCCAYPNFTYNVQGTNGGLQGTMVYGDPLEITPQQVRQQIEQKWRIHFYVA